LCDFDFRGNFRKTLHGFRPCLLQGKVSH
jgi:hypothetical protein